jgi:2-isopropylmalate synthase
MAVANSLAAIAAGASQAECTLTGIGERAGYAALEEIVMALATRRDLYDAKTNIRTTRLSPTARMFANLIGTTIPRNKAIVGDNAFAHESGIHQHGMLKHRATYEIMRPEDVGCARSSLVLGKHSGRHALRERIAALGHTVEESGLDDLFVRFKALCDRKKEVRDGDLEALALGRDPEAAGPWVLTHLHATSHLGGTASAVVRIAHEDGRVASGGAIGDGPVDAVLRSLGRAIGHDLSLDEFHIRALGQGGDAQGQAALSIVHEGRELRGQAVSTDIVEAAALAVLEIVNRIEHGQSRNAAALRTATAG